MDDEAWMTCTDVPEMLECLRVAGTLSGRKWRLFGVACCRRIDHLLSDERSRRAVDVAERYADGHASYEELDAAFESSFDAWEELKAEETRDPTAFRAANRDPLAAAAWAASDAAHPDESADGVAHAATYASGSPGEQAAQSDLLRCLFGSPRRSEPMKALWLTPMVRRLAAAIYEERAFDRLPMLADTLEEAGCDDMAILAHCRSDTAHARGCWVIDLVLGKA